MKPFLLTLAFCTLNFVACKQTISPHVPEAGTIDGLVFDSATRQPVDSALVTIRLVTDTLWIDSLMTDVNGAFKFSGLPPTEYFARIQRTGYLEYHFTAVVKDDQTTPPRIPLVDTLTVN